MSSPTAGRLWPARLVGAIAALFGLLLALEGGWLLSKGGTSFYLVSGIGYLIAGAGLWTRRRFALWLQAIVFLATLIWAAVEVDWNAYTVYTLIPRLDVAIGLAVLFMLPWVWRPVVRGIDSIAAILPGAAGLLLVVAAIGVIVSQPWADRTPAAMHGGEGYDVPSFGAAAADWPVWGRTNGGSRYSPLDQITPDNVGNLQQAWRYQSGDLKFTDEGPPHFGAESTPIKVGNTVYTCTPNAWIIALDPVTGEQKWKTKPSDVDDSQNNFVNCRGVSYYSAPADYQASDGGQACKNRILAPTMGPFIVALDAETGERCEDFGNGGLLDMRQGMGILAPGSLVQTSPPLVMDGVLVTGGNVLDNWFVGEPSGVIRGWNPVTGKELWHWDLGREDPTAPLAQGETFTPGTPNAWGVMTGDPDLGVLYAPLGNSTPDYYGPGRSETEMKYSGSIVALDIHTGEERWHFQESHTDVWDYDIPIGPSLLQWPDGDGNSFPALLSTNKRGQLFVLDRRTGKPLMPVEEKPVATGPEGGKMKSWLSPTQPYSTEMPSFTPAKLKVTDMWGATPFDHMWCRARYQELYYGGDASPPTLQGSLMYPTFDGVTDWYGAALDPQGRLNIVSNHLPFVGRLIPRDRAAGKGPIKQWDGQGTPPHYGGQNPYKPQYGKPYAVSLHPFMSPIKAPCIAPPWATLSQVDLAKRKVEWTVPLGDTRHTAPFGFKHDLPLPTGVFSLGSGVVTKGGVVFISGTADQMLRAYDENTGEVLWQVELPAGAQSTPSIYEGEDGREYIVITAGGHEPMGTKYGDYTIAYALPQGT